MDQYKDINWSGLFAVCHPAAWIRSVLILRISRVSLQFAVSQAQRYATTSNQQERTDLKDRIISSIQYVVLLKNPKTQSQDLVRASGPPRQQPDFSTYCSEPYKARRILPSVFLLYSYSCYGNIATLSSLSRFCVCHAESPS